MERTHTRWGRFRPYIFIGAPLLVLFTILLSIIALPIFWAVACFCTERITVKKEEQGSILDGLKLVFRNRNLVCAIFYAMINILLLFFGPYKSIPYDFFCLILYGFGYISGPCHSESNQNRVRSDLKRSEKQYKNRIKRMVYLLPGGAINHPFFVSCL